ELGRKFTEICANKKIRFFIMYGQTEATARMSYLSATDNPEKVGSIGKPIPGGEFWLVTPEGEKITECDQVGELIYRGENVSMGFAESLQDLTQGDCH